MFSYSLRFSCPARLPALTERQKFGVSASKADSITTAPQTCGLWDVCRDLSKQHATASLLIFVCSLFDVVH